MWMLFVVLAIANPVERVLFVVGDRIVTQSDVAFELFFIGHDRSPLPSFAADAGPVAERLRDIAAVRQLAGDTSVFSPNNAEVRARAHAFLTQWPRPDDGLAALEAWGMDEAAFLGFVYSRLVVENCVVRSVPLPEAPEVEAERLAWLARYDVWVAGVRQRATIREPRGAK